MNFIFNRLLNLLFFTTVCLQLNATIIEGNTTVVAGGEHLNLDVRINTLTDIVTLTMNGPADTYFAFGFGTNNMASGTYAVVMEGDDDVFEQSLGGHSAGSILAPTITVVSNTVLNGNRTVVATRSRLGESSAYYDFPTVIGNINFIYGRSNNSSYSYHSGSKGAATLAIALPVDFISFDVKENGKSVQLDWRTAQETNNEKFIIERSTDNTVWNEIGKVAGVGNSIKPSSYMYIDDSPNPGINFYRLKQVDFDENVSYSTIKGIAFSPDLEKEDIIIFPTVTSAVFHVSATTTFDQKARIQVLNSMYIPVIDRFWEDGMEDQELNISNLPNGMYFVVVSHNDWYAMERIIKN